jgi:hypothetical protein
MASRRFIFIVCWAVGMGRAIAGHLVEAHVRPTLEIVRRASPAHMRKQHDADSGLALIDLKAAHPKSHRLHGPGGSAMVISMLVH